MNTDKFSESSPEYTRLAIEKSTAWVPIHTSKGRAIVNTIVSTVLSKKPSDDELVQLVKNTEIRSQWGYTSHFVLEKVRYIEVDPEWIKSVSMKQLVSSVNWYLEKQRNGYYTIAIEYEEHAVCGLKYADVLWIHVYIRIS
jgi:hypothetical protein